MSYDSAEFLLCLEKCVSTGSRLMNARIVDNKRKGIPLDEQFSDSAHGYIRDAEEVAWYTIYKYGIGIANYCKEKSDEKFSENLFGALFRILVINAKAVCEELWKNEIAARDEARQISLHIMRDAVESKKRRAI